MRIDAKIIGMFVLFALGGGGGGFVGSAVRGDGTKEILDKLTAIELKLVRMEGDNRDAERQRTDLASAITDHETRIRKLEDARRAGR